MSTYLAAFVCFCFIRSYQGEDALSAASIIGIFQPILVLNENIKFLGSALNACFNIQITLDRLVKVMNSENPRLESIGQENQH